MPKKTAIMDASSAIIICKSELHLLLVELYDIVLPESVYREITVKPYAGSAEYSQLVEKKKVRVSASRNYTKRPGTNGLDEGEYDTIQLYYAGLGDFIIIDDGPAAKYCKEEKIPFINALLFPVVLKFVRIKDEEFCCKAMERVVASGRYSREILTFARECQMKDLEFALP